LIGKSQIASNFRGTSVEHLPNVLTGLPSTLLALTGLEVGCERTLPTVSTRQSLLHPGQHNGRAAEPSHKDKAEAKRLFHAKCEASRIGSLNLQIARNYMVAVDPELPTRTWRQVVRFIIEQKEPGPTRHRWESVEKDEAFSKLWKMRIAETRPDQLLSILKSGTVSTNVVLRRMHNFAFDMNWLAWPILPKKKWPKVVYREKRGITREEHEKIIAREINPEHPPI
jgi:hypothetical protein